MTSPAASAAAPAATPSSPGLPRQAEQIALLLGVGGLAVGLAGLAFGIFNHQPRFVTSWLLGLTFWLSLGVGMLFLTMIWYVFDASWPVIIRRQFEHALGAMKWLGLLFLPLLALPFLGQPGVLWKWMDPAYVLPGGETVGNDVLYAAKAVYLNVPWFLARAVLYFGVFIGLAEFFRKASFTMEKDGDIRWARRCRVVSALGLPALAFAATFAAFDWLMSLEYHWFSTMFGVWFFAGSVRAATAAAAVLCILLAWQGHLGGGLFNRAHRYLLGCLLLAFTVFWAYISFSQYFLIYNANIPEETYWYNMRMFSPKGGLSSWGWVLMSLLFLHFLFPFLVLLWYKTKVITGRLLFIASWILFFHLIDLYFNIVPRKYAVEATKENPLGYIVPEFTTNGLDLLVDLGALLGIGGLCAYVFLRSLRTAEPIPVRDPRIEACLHCHE